MSTPASTANHLHATGGIGRFCLTTAILLMSMLGLSRWRYLQVAGAAPQPTVTGEFYQDFRGRKPISPLLNWSGKDGEEVVDPTDKGLRIQLPATRTEKAPVGLALRSRIEGDFEITAGYELLQMDPPKKGSGVGVELYVMLDGPSQDGLGLARVKEVRDMDVYKYSHNTTVDRQRRFHIRATPSTAKFGHMRISRKGRTVTFLAADEEGEFRPLESYDIEPTSVKYIRVAAYPGESTEPVDVRLLDLKITSNDEVGMQALVDSAIVSTDEARADVSRGWLVAIEIIALTVILTLLGLGVWIYLRRRRPEQ